MEKFIHLFFKISIFIVCKVKNGFVFLISVSINYTAYKMSFEKFVFEGILLNS